MNRNPHWLPGETSADHARRRGWTVGTRLISHGDSGSTTITITAIGRENILALPDDNRSEGAWTLQCRDWQLETPEQETTMTTEFNASNGIEIEVSPDGYLLGKGDYGSGPTYATAGPEGIAALREYFTAERDAELGRWRDEESPDYVVYPARAGSITILHEPTGRQRYLTGRAEAKIATGQFADTARRYFAAHPEPKPWHDAKPGEAWAIEFKYEGLEESRLALVIDIDNSPFEVRAQGDSPTVWVNRKDPRITAGRRIWPT